MRSARHVWGLVTGQDWAVSRSAGVAGDAHGRWSLECGAVRVHRRPENHGIAAGTGPRNVAAPAVSKADDMSDEELIRAKSVPIWATGRWSGDPLPVGRLHQLAQHQ